MASQNTSSGPVLGSPRTRHTCRVSVIAESLLAIGSPLWGIPQPFCARGTGIGTVLSTRFGWLTRRAGDRPRAPEECAYSRQASIRESDSNSLPPVRDLTS
jgi:hypothetical protein